MSEPSSPWDDAPVEESLPPPKRRWRPWWQWNILTLFGVLFVFAWFRYLFDMGPGPTWVFAFFLLAIWGIAPLFFFENFLTTLPAQAMQHRKLLYDRMYAHERRRRWMNRFLRTFSTFGFVLLALSILHLVILVGFLLFGLVGYAIQTGFDIFNNVRWDRLGAQLAVLLLPPLFEIVTCGTLIALCEIALRLDKPFQETPPPNDEDGNGKTASSQPQQAPVSTAEVDPQAADST